MSGYCLTARQYPSGVQSCLQQEESKTIRVQHTTSNHNHQATTQAFVTVRGRIRGRFRDHDSKDQEPPSLSMNQMRRSSL